MNQLFQFLTNNPILILILVGWLFSALAGAATKAAKRQAQGQPRQRPEFDAVRDQQRQTEQARTTASSSRPRSPDDIARELREMLGLESGPERKPAPQREPGSQRETGSQPSADEARTSHWDRHTGDDEDIHVPTVAARELRKKAKPKRAVPAPLAGVAKRHTKGLLEHHIGQPRRLGVRRIAFDRKHAIAAVIGMELLGPPRSLRAYRGPSDEQQ